ncbi:hypothetical protein M8C21_033735 [Ambrosia artemisiifolia]|uniref:Pollen Ole e 1 allergen and extensin family protein n=1 Tax=Ambrosia artemisiifolia TaxID=4212 RepID=A0AAD5CZ57_AMBAR|nr:hypothetical protein M8C21_033735 [Ambrosia artemisiifolia]
MYHPQMQNMTISFQGNINIMRILLLIFFGFIGAHETRARYVTENPLVELSSGDDLRRVAGYGDEKLSTVVVSGSILCDVCLDKSSNLQSHPIPGASMAVSCDTGKKTSKSDWVMGTTDEYGDFLVDLPSHLHAIPNMENRCIVRIIELPKSSPCYQAFTGQHRTITFSSVDNGVRAYTAHEFHLTPKYSHPCMIEQATS